jgi:hypothetical protein
MKVVPVSQRAGLLPHPAGTSESCEPSNRRIGLANPALVTGWSQPGGMWRTVLVTRYPADV